MSATRRRGRSLSARLLAGAVVVFLFAALSAAVILQTDDDSNSGSTTSTVQLTGNARELVDLLAKKDKATYHARYTGSSPDAAQVVLETWQRPPNIRQDSQLVVNNQPVETRAFVTDKQQVRCVRLNPAAGDAGWTCQPGTVSDTDPLASIKTRLGEGEVSVRDTNIGGRAVRCFQFTVDGATTELCVTTDLGIPVLVRAADSELNLVALDQDITDSTFTPPAPVQGE